MFDNLKLVFLMIAGCIFADQLCSQERVFHQAWPEKAEINALSPLDLQLIDPSLPAPRLRWQREYSKGLSNTVYWYADDTEIYVESEGFTFLYYEIQASYQTEHGITVLWGLEEAGVDSATFVNLPEGVEIAYNLRYFARNPEGGFLMSWWSDSLIVIQDNIRPSLDQQRSGIINISSPAGQQWVDGDTLNIRIAASDSYPGKVMQIGVREQSNDIDLITYHQVIPPLTSVDTVIVHKLFSGPKRSIEISWWVVDIALHESDTQYVDIAIWPPEDGYEQLIVFPNPFNPFEDDGCKIRIGFEGEQTVHIFDAFGQLIRTLKKGSNEQFVVWDGRNNRNQIVGNGGYICVLEGKNSVYSKIAVLK